jgi:hypothetical protein
MNPCRRFAHAFIAMLAIAVVGCDTYRGAAPGPARYRTGGTANPTVADARFTLTHADADAVPGVRTPDPSPGSFLPLPPYGIQVMNNVTVDPALHCLDFQFIDAVVDALRLRDTRWGYLCRGTGCTTGSMDKIAYHATAGPEVAGALGVWVVDIIGSACEAPTRQWGVDGFDPAGQWTGRGRV